MNAVVKLRPGCTCSRDRDVQPHRVLRDRCRSDFGPIRWPHNDVHVTTGDGVQLAVRDYDPPALPKPSSSCTGSALLVPPPFLRALQIETPVTRVRLCDGSAPWLSTGYHEERTLLADPQISNDTTLPHYPHPTPSGKELRKQSRTFINMDDPEYNRLHRILTARFSIKRVEAMGPVMQTMVRRWPAPVGTWQFSAGRRGGRIRNFPRRPQSRQARKRRASHQIRRAFRLAV
jgi:hypothetical protein